MFPIYKLEPINVGRIELQIIATDKGNSVLPSSPRTLVCACVYTLIHSVMFAFILRIRYNLIHIHKRNRFFPQSKLYKINASTHMVPLICTHIQRQRQRIIYLASHTYIHLRLFVFYCC